MRCRHTSTGRSSDLNSLEAFSAGHPPADLFNDRAQRSSHGHFDHSGAGAFSGEGKHLGSRSGRGADGSEPGASVEDQSGHIRDGLDIVDDGRLSEESLFRRIGRTRAGHSPFSLDAADQRRLLAADERAGPFPDHDFQIESAVENILSQQSVLPCLFDRPFQTPDRQRILRPDIDIRASSADRIRGDRQSFDQTVRIALNQRPIHKRSRIALIRVADHVLLIACAVQSILPLGSRGESASAAAAETALLHLVADFRRSHRMQRLCKRAVPSARQIFLD